MENEGRLTNETLNDAVDTLLGLFGENAPENAALDIAYGFEGNDIDSEEIWERYCNRIEHMEA